MLLVTTFFLLAIQTKALGKRSDRDEWEKHFSRVYIQPVLEVNSIIIIITLDFYHFILSFFFQKVEDQLGHVMTAIMNDDKQG